MKLHDHFDHLADDVTVDPHQIASSARREGTRMRRRRHLATATGTVAALSLVALGGWALAGGGSTEAQFASEPSPSPSTVQPRPTDFPVTSDSLDGRATTAALRAAVSDVASGSFSSFGGQGAPAGAGNSFGEFAFTPADGLGAGKVAINVMRASDREIFTCVGWRPEACSIETLPNGDRLRTYTEDDTDDDRRVVADLWSAERSMRVVAYATNGLFVDGEQWAATRPDPVLTLDQLTDVVTRDFWALTSPKQFADEGAELTPYVDYDQLAGDCLRFTIDELAEVVGSSRPGRGGCPSAPVSSPAE